MLLVIVGERNGDQDEQRHNGEHHNAQNRQGEQGHIELFVQVNVDVLHKVVGLFASFTDLLQLIVGRYHHHCRRDQCRDHDKGDHAHQQDLKRIIVIVYNVFHRGNIEHHLHFYGAEGAELCQVGYAKECQEIQRKALYKCDQKRLHQLAVANIAQTPYKEG